MKLLSFDDARRWCETRGLTATAGGEPPYLQYSRGGANTYLQVRSDVAPASLLTLAYTLLLQDLAQPADEDFAGALVWLRDWDIWNETSERAGLRLLQTIRQTGGAAGIPSLKDAPAQFYDPREIVDAQIAATVTLLFQWDALVVPASARYFAYASHHGLVRVNAMNPAILTRIRERFEAVGWNPEES